ncbi:MAG: TonB-dependent receptor [Porticoccaceae bacterium]|nr:TonB-dependent receptor [Porticoccaceae bacterium]
MNKKSIRTLSSLALAVAAASSGAYGAQLEEIIVTAQKRAESLQDVPISMTAVSGERLEDAGVTDFQSLSEFVPNLSISENAVNTIITMRGISVGANQSFEQSVGVYVDGVHYGKSRQIRTGLFDLQQVEVLRGPQGILFGKNTLAGAINVTTAEPEMGQDGVSGKIAVTAESNNGEMIEGNLNYSPSDNLAFRLAFRDQADDGYMKNSFAGAPSDMPSTDEEIWRFTTMWNPSESTSVKFTHGESSYERIGANSTQTNWLPNSPVGAADTLMFAVISQVYPTLGDEINAGDGTTMFRDSITLGGCALEEHVKAEGRYGIGSNSASSCDNDGERPEGTYTETADTSLVIDIESDSGYSFHSVTGRNTYDYQDGIDADWLPVQFVGRADISNYEQTSQEFRISSPTDDRFSFVAGVYWSESEQEIDRVVQVDGTLGNPLNVNGVTAFGAAQGTYGQGGTDSFLAIPVEAIAEAGLEAAGALVGLTEVQIGATVDAWLFPANPAAAGVYTNFGVEGATMWSQAGRVSYYNQKTDTTAAFFQGTYDLTDDLTLTAGVRYTEEEKTAIASADLTSSATGYATPDTNPMLALLQDSLFGVYAHSFNEKRDTDQLVPAVNLQWAQSDTNNFYVSYSEGFKSGGFNSVDDQNPVIEADGTVLRNVPGVGFEYDDESAESWEIGGKHVFMDGAMNFNWAYFDSTYEDQQVSTFVGLGFVVANAASSNISGLEMDLAWQATDKLYLGASLSFLDGEYGSFDSAGCTAVQAAALLALNEAAPLGELRSDSPVTTAAGCQQQFLGDGTPSGSSQDISGGQLGSDFEGSLTADYVSTLSNGTVWYAGIDVNFVDDYFMTGDLDPIDVQKGYEKVNLRLGLKGDDWDLMFFGRNVTNEITAAGAADTPLASGAHFRYMAPGEIYGARFSYSF